MKKDINGKILAIGDKVHIVGKGDKTLYIIELGETTVGLSGDKNVTNCYGVLYDKIVKLKKQD